MSDHVSFGRLHAARLGLIVLLIASGCSGDTSDPQSNDPGEVVGNPEVNEPKAGLDAPVAVAPFLNGVFPPRTPNDVGSTNWSVVPSFPSLDLGNTLVIAPNPSNNRLYVGTRDGYVRSFENDQAAATAEEFIDLTDRAWAVWDGGFLGLVFHPEFGQPGSPFEKFFYVYYSSHCNIKLRADGTGYETDLSTCDTTVPKSSTNGFFGAYLRLSRFEVDATGVGDSSSEKVMINMRLYNGSHRGGGIVFRHELYEGETDPRRFLYLTIGDQFRYETAQDIQGNLEGGTVRLAIDVLPDGNGWSCPLGSHVAPRVYSTSLGHSSEELSGQWYCIPDDNPWSGVASTFEEYCSLGHRNPHRLALDPVTNHMWSGEIGESTREEINIIECGNNYGWPFREGLTTGVRTEPSSYEGVLTDPVLDFIRSEARAIIGGYVYRGSTYPQLYGRYLAGDYVTGNIWAITLDESTMTATKEYLTNFTPGGLGTWGQDKDGEVYLGDVIGGATLWQLEGDNQGVGDPPSLLSELGAFDDIINLTPSPVWVPYTLNQPFWSDGALKFRWIALPNDGTRDTADEQIGFAENDYWTFPVGTVLMKHFELPLDEADPSIKTRLETRFQVLGDDGKWYGLTYRWLPNQVDATLLTTGETADYTIQLAGGGTRNQTWAFPSRIECLSCHRQESGGALGLRTHQQNGDLFYPSTGRVDNQLATWNHLGMFSPAIDPLSIPSMPRSRALGDVTASLELRARSWLDSNCSSCHQPGTGIAGFDTRIWTPLGSQGLVYGPVRDDLGVAGMTVLTPGDPALSSLYLRMDEVGPNAMPPLAKALAEEPAVDLMAEWILRVDPGLPQNGVSYDYHEDDTINALSDLVAANVVRTGTATTFDISIRSRDDDFGFRFTSYLQVLTGGDYTFFTNSDDGSQLFIDGALVVDNSGLHAPQERSGTLTLVPGFYAIEVTMFERGGGQVLDVTWQGPDSGGLQQPINPGQLFLSVPTPTSNEPPLLTNPGNQTSTLGDVISLDLQFTDPDGDLPYFEATGLPPGLAIDPVSGQISGVPSVVGTNEVTASVSDGPEVSWVEFDWLIDAPTGPYCGDGIVQDPEACDDGNNVNGDGCDATCQIEVITAVCGDGIVDGPTETCEPPGTAICNDSCTFRIPLCGDGFLTPPEQCEDGNALDGDGCSATCSVENSNLTQLGTIIAAVPDSHFGNFDLEWIRDGLVSTQYDTWDGKNLALEDWIGYEFPSLYTFDRVVFQEGPHFFDGGWFETLTVQVRQGGVWTEVSSLVISPSYPGNNGVNKEIFEMTFAPVSGDAIRIYGRPGGSAAFISVTELEAFASFISPTCGNLILDPGEGCDDGNNVNGDGCTADCQLEMVAVCGDGIVTTPDESCEPPGTDTCNDNCTARAPLCGDGFVTAPEECDDFNTIDGDGCSATCTIEIQAVCGDGVVTAPEDCDPPNTNTCAADCTTRVAVCGDGFLTPPEQCEDGNAIDGDGCSALCTTETGELTQLGTIIAAVPDSHFGSFDLEWIRDGAITQYDTYDGNNTATEDWIGYEFVSNYPFGRVVFWEGPHFFDGGWFDSLTVQVRQSGVWTEVSGLVITPAYPGNNGVNRETFEMTFEPINGDAIRIYGDPGGSKDFISVTELQVFASLISPACGNGTLDEGEECDDGNNLNGDGCAANCVEEAIAVCGDGIVTPPETCELPGTDTCNDTCTARVPVCGDGFVTAPEECDDLNTVDGDGCSATCTIEIPAVCGDGIVTAPEDCDPPGTDTCADDCTTRVAVCGDGFLTPPEQCEDGNLIDGDGCSAACTVETGELTQLGVIIAAVPDSHFGNFDPEWIRDGAITQYDTWDGKNAAVEDWIGYEYASDFVFDRVVFWEGPHFFDGGWFDSLTVQVRQGSTWVEVSDLVISPTYPGNNGVNRETFDMTFTPILGNAIRIYGEPGGSADFISVTELQVFSPLP